MAEHDRWRYPACPDPSCRQMQWTVRQNKKTAEIQLRCAACGLVVLTSETPKAIAQAQAQAGQSGSYAPSGGPYKQP